MQANRMIARKRAMLPVSTMTRPATSRAVSGLWELGDHIPVYSTQSMSTRLDTILATTRATVAAAKARVPAAELERRAAAHQPRGWVGALRRRAAMGPAVIAEIK